NVCVVSEISAVVGVVKFTIAAILVLTPACSQSATPSAVPAQPDVPKTAVSPTTLANASFSKPRIETEVQQVFELNYQARTLRPGGKFAVAALRGLGGGA